MATLKAADERRASSKQQPNVVNPEDERRASAANAYIAAGKALSIFSKMEKQGSCGLDRDSVYGAAIAMPQIARSVGWPRTLISVVIRCYSFLLLNIGLQFFVVAMIRQEAEVMNAFSGQMHLCDFAAYLDQCPDAPTCVGPGGTRITPARLYSFDTWNTRKFVRDSLLSLFPDMHKDIMEKVDPGEYGLESYGCRLVCCFLFMMAVVDDLRASINLAFCLIRIPSENEAWISYETPDWADKEEAKKVHGWSELDLVQFKIAGMSVFWKILNFVLVVVPKVMIWFLLTSAGFSFLMETAGIVDVTVNAMAMTFILSIDEMLLACLATKATKHMLENLQNYELYDTEEEDNETDEQVLERFQTKETVGVATLLDFTFYLNLFPTRLAFVFLLMATFIVRYYWLNCYVESDGAWVSKDLYQPTGVSNNPFSILFGGTPTQTTLLWSMPQQAGPA